MTVNPRIQARLDDQTATWLEDRAARSLAGASASQQAMTELAAWRAFLAAELRRVRLTLGEASCIADVMNGTIIPVTPFRPGIVFSNCYDAFDLAGDRVSSYGEKHGIDEGKLLDYLRSLGPAADAALADAVSRWWKSDADATAEGFAAAGICVTDRDAV